MGKFFLFLGAMTLDGEKKRERAPVWSVDPEETGNFAGKILPGSDHDLKKKLGPKKKKAPERKSI